MDIVLFNPAPRTGWQAQRRIELPLSLLSPATPLDREGYRVKIIDEYVNPHWKQELLESVTPETICFGVTSMTGPQILHALAACRVVRERWPELPIVWGGVHGSLRPEQTAQHPLVDIVVIGEGEETFPELVKTLAAKRSIADVAGICYQEGTQTRRTASRPFVDLNAAAPLSYRLIDINNYRRRLFGIDHVSFNSSRGCTFRCSFCWDPVFHQRKWRAMQPETVLDHLKRVIRDYDIRGFLFTDDHFFIDMKRAYGILEAIVRADLNISISKLQIRADTICRMDKDFLDLLVRAGVKRLTVGVESGSQRILDLIKKDVTVEQVIEANHKLKDLPIVPIYLFMMGLPSETTDELAQSIKLAIRLTTENPHAAKTFNIYTPFPATELYNVALEYGLEEPDRLEDWARFNFRNVHRQTAWLSDETRKLIEGLDFPLMFLGKAHFVNPYKQTNPLVVALARMYYPLALYRVRNMEARLPLETKVVKALGLFGRQD